jgi:hypothetical protein
MVGTVRPPYCFTHVVVVLLHMSCLCVGLKTRYKLEVFVIHECRLALTLAEYWIGLLKTPLASTTTTTYFLDFSVTSYRPPWASGEPSGSSLCTRLIWDTTRTPNSARLGDNTCSNSYNYVCKMAMGKTHNTQHVYLRLLGCDERSERVSLQCVTM